jgi:hypothetical protein
MVKVKTFILHMWIFARSLHTAQSTDSRWGSVALLLSFAFFFFGLAIAILSFYNTSLWSLGAMIIMIIFGLIGGGMFIWAIKLGYGFWKNYDKTSILIITEDKVEYDINSAQIKDNQIILITDKYEIRIINREDNLNDKPK